jgi:hypothetical protein
MLKTIVTKLTFECLYLSSLAESHGES